MDPKTEGTPPPAPAPKMVEQSTFDRVVTAKNNLEAQVAALKAERDGLLEKVSTTDTLAGQLEEWKGKATQADQRFSRFQQIAAITGNADPEAVELVEFAYGKQPAEDRPELAAWLAGFKEDPSKAPLALRSVFGQAAPQEPKVPAPRRPPGSTTPPGGAPAVTSEKIAAVRKRAQETGDWSEYQDLRKQMGIVR